jgi:hypothetical protein
MRRESGRLNTMPTPHTTFPVAEGIGIFVGIVAWNLLADGHLEIIKAGAIAISCAVVWYGLRCWRDRPHNKHH